ncbi:MAG: serine/threonine phosphatase, partial [Cyanobacteria bacterium J06626_14]
GQPIANANNDNMHVEHDASASITEMLDEAPPWLAILTLNDPLDAEFFDPAVIDLTAITDLLQQKAIALQESGYLDLAHRYRISKCLLKTPDVNQTPISPYLEISIFDDHPSNLSRLDQLLNQPLEGASDRPNLVLSNARLDGMDSFESSTTGFGWSADESTGNASDGTSSSSDDAITEVLLSSKPSKPSADDHESLTDNQPALEENQTTTTIGAAVELPEAIAPAAVSSQPPLQSYKVPNIAAVYLAVQDQFYPSLPQIYDAWMTDDISVIVVENRNALQGLEEAIQLPGTKALQILHWFHEMTELWAVLQPKHYHQSLLDLTNLRVDEDQILCITCLYRPSKKTEFPLSALGELWQHLLQSSPLYDNKQLMQLCERLAQGHISSVDQLRFQLEEAAMQLNHERLALPEPKPAIAPPPPANPNPPGDSVLELGVWPDMQMRSEDDLAGELGLFSEGDETPTVVLPMRLFHLTDVGATDIGRQRDHNEDYFSLQSETQKRDTPEGRKFSARGMYVLCDGMGGHAAGEVASALAVSTLDAYFAEHWTEQFPSKDDIRDGIRKANKSIYDLNQENACYGSGRMGTTLVMMMVDDIKVAIAHVGDSRVYKFCRRTGLEQITVDHEVGQREIQRGVEPAIAYARPDAYQLTQALGPRDSEYINPGIQTLEVTEDTLFILCSDGLSDNNLLERFRDTHIEPMLSSQTNLSQALTNLIDLANQHNGHDNITAIAVRMKVRPKVQGLQ